MRPGQYNNNNNKNRNNRNRNRRPGGGGGQPGGNGANRVYDSNGPDVKLRGTAQTIAEKYMQLARDAQSSGDNVAAEGYYQFADHYYRVWLAAQPVGQPIQFSRRSAEEEYDEDGNEIAAAPEGTSAESDAQDGGDAPMTADAGEGQPEGENQGYQNRNRSDRPNNNNQNREGGNNRNFRQRWPRRNDRYNQDGQQDGPPNANMADGQVNDGQAEHTDRQDSYERPMDEAVVVQRREVEAPEAGNWEAPSFLTRPTPIAPVETLGEEEPAPRPRGRKPRAAAPVEDAPQGE